MIWKIALSVAVVALFIFVTYKFIQSIKEFKEIAEKITFEKKDEENDENEE